LIRFDQQSIAATPIPNRWTFAYIDAKVETADQLWVEMIGNFGKVLPMADYSDHHYFIVKKIQSQQ
jgi:hypothetical protein